MGLSVGDLFLDLNLNTKNFNKQLNATSSIAQKSFDKMGGMLAKALSTAALVSFGKSCLDLGSDLQEVQNVVDVTFPNMNNQVNDFAKNAINQFGLSETVAKRMTGTFGSMAKAFGFSEGSAYDMATALTGLAGDVVSFYNLDPTEAYTKLKSVFSGETESLKDLGVVMTQNALDQYALANGYGKTTSAMNEQEKVALRLAFVTDQLSAAGGDFSRTSDSWANKVRVLSLNFDSLKATLGQGFINVLSPLISMLNTVVLKLQEAATWFTKFTSLLSKNKKTSTSMGSVSSAAKEVANNVGGIGDTAKKVAKQLGGLANFDELNVLKSSSDSNNTPSTSSSGVDFGGLDMSNGISEATEIDTSKMETSIDRMREKINSFVDFFKNNGSVIISICAGIVAGFLAFEAIKNWPLMMAGIVNIKNGVLGLIDTFKTFMRFPNLVTTAFTGLSMTSLLVVAGIAAVVASLVYLWNTSDGFRELVIKAVDNVKGVLLNIWNNVLVPLFNFLKDMFNAVIMPIASFLATAFVSAVDCVGSIFLHLWNEILAPLANFLVSRFGEKFAEFADKARIAVSGVKVIFSSLSLFIKGIFDTIKGIFNGIITFISGVFTGNWRKAWQGVKNIFSTVVAGFANIFKKPINAIIDGINDFISGINKIKIPSWVPGVGGKGFNISKIPRLAEGGYVQANTPQLAMIGDNKRYGEIVTPENKMYEIMMSALEAYGANNASRDDIQVLVSILYEILESIKGLRLIVDGDSLNDDQNKRDIERALRTGKVI